MSLYTAGEILIFIVAAALIGLVIGWILRSLRMGVQLAGLESMWRSRYEEEVARLTTLADELATETARRQDLEQGHEADTQLLRSLQEESEDRFSEVAQLREALQRSGDDLTVMSGQLAERSRRITELEADLASTAAENERFAAGLEEAARRIAELDRRAAVDRAAQAEEVEELRQRLTEREPLRLDLRQQTEETVIDLRAGSGADAQSPPLTVPGGRVGVATRLAPAEARLRMAEVAERTALGSPPPDDDLELVHGIGPKIAGLLKSMGVTSFAQIARFEDRDVETVAAALDTFKDRIRRDDWMSDARRLHRQKYRGEP